MRYIDILGDGRACCVASALTSRPKKLFTLSAAL